MFSFFFGYRWWGYTRLSPDAYKYSMLSAKSNDSIGVRVQTYTLRYPRYPQSYNNNNHQKHQKHQISHKTYKNKFR